VLNLESKWFLSSPNEGIVTSIPHLNKHEIRNLQLTNHFEQKNMLI